MTTKRSRAVLITGCSSGIGRAAAARLARHGWRVYATARNVEAIADLRQEGCELLALDVTDEDSMRAAVAAVESDVGAVDVLVNNAGFSQSGALETISVDDLRRQFETNVFGLLRLTQLVLPGMRRERSGTIVNLGSMGGRLTFPGGGAYHATKYAVEALSDVLRFEVKGFGIDVILIEPGLIHTGFADAAVGTIAAEDGAYAAFNVGVAEAMRGGYEGPLGRLGGDAGDVARAIEKAITAGRAPTRVPVTPSARVMIAARRLLGDRLWDRLVARAYPRPGAGGR